MIKVFSSDEINLKHVRFLYEECGWGYGESVKKAVENSYCSAIAFDGDKPVGFCRVISDGVVYSLLVDTMVLPSIRRRGVGKELVLKMVEHCRDQGIFIMKLISSEEGREFYKSIGFNQCSDQEPGMVLML